MQTPIYGSKGEMALMQKLWSHEIKNDPEKFVLAVFPWGQPGSPLEKQRGPREWQRSILRRIKLNIDNNRNLSDTPELYEMLQHSVASGRGIGKSALVSWLTLWMITTRIGSSVIISANSQEQLEKTTWAEIGKWVAMSVNSHWWEITSRSIKPAEWIKQSVEEELKKGTGYWGAEGKLWSAERPDAYAGPHNFDGLMVIFDEASGIPDEIWGVAEGFFTEPIPDKYWFAFSNPRRNTGYFYQTFNDYSNVWTSEQIDARDVEDVAISTYEKLIAQYGEESNRVKIEVYGEFPDTDDVQFISSRMVKEAMNRNKYDDDSAPVIIGVDPAKGNDDTVILVRKGRDVVSIQRYSTPDTMKTVSLVIKAIEEFSPTLVNIDEGGVGAGVVDRLKEQGYKVRGVNFGWASSDNRMFKNKRAEMWFETKEWLRTASIPNDKKLFNDLVSARIDHSELSGALKLVSKHKLTTASPDSADALALTFAFKVAPKKANGVKPPTAIFNNSSTSWMSF